MTKVIFAADHAGFALKESLKPLVVSLGYEVEDVGAHELDSDDDYVPFMKAAARLVSHNPHETRAILCGGSGQGEAMTANRFKHVRAAVYYGGSPTLVPLSREHNDANVLSLGARFMTEGEAAAAVRVWLTTPFSNAPRHARRIKEIDR